MVAAADVERADRADRLDRFEALEISSAAGMPLIGYTAEPGSPAEEALRLLACRVATEHTPAPARITDARTD
ncbi:hypothetical protein [Prauserella cavernicola]|uniref:Uncharacterized protein n=1 Tax=Prauserella cavernicola TaxID=2800127 RepID=A0A934R062_9PSEU|nr:hypothetical protein [Prauserella cavernicola]MBK1789440.1 hypothetical protein [Prauserella cavernicola]